MRPRNPRGVTSRKTRMTTDPGSRTRDLGPALALGLVSASEVSALAALALGLAGLDVGDLLGLRSGSGTETLFCVWTDAPSSAWRRHRSEQ